MLLIQTDALGDYVYACTGIIHLGGVSTKQVKTKNGKQWNKSMLLFCNKHKVRCHTILASILRMLFFITIIGG